MSGEREPAGPHRPARRPVIAIRALLIHREYIKTTAYVLPRRAKILVLQMMERFRRERRDGRTAPPAPPAPLPEMTGAELVREINWRIGTLPPHDAEIVARYIRRLTRWRAERSTRDGGSGVAPLGPGGRKTFR